MLAFRSSIAARFVGAVAIGSLMTACALTASVGRNDAEGGRGSDTASAPTDGDSQDTGSQDAGSQDAGSQDAGSQNAGSQNAGSQDGGATDAPSLGDGGTIAEPAALMVASGQSFSCGVTAAGAAVCWGGNGNGQCGIETLETDGRANIVHTLSSGVRSIAAGQKHACAVTTSGGAKCWGSNEYGQVGDGSTDANVTLPRNVSGLTSGVATIGAGEAFSCALLTTGSVKCWGIATAGQLGNGATSGQSALPVAVQGLPGPMRSMVVGSEHACAVDMANAVYCWGANDFGALGRGVDAPLVMPTAALATAVNEPVAMMASGMHFNCANTLSGKLLCWGANSVNGLLGIGTTSTRSLTPVTPTGFDHDVEFVSAGRSSACAITSVGAYCWGSNAYGLLGSASALAKKTSPDLVWGTTNPAARLRQIAIGFDHACGASPGAFGNGGFACWGNNVAGVVSPATLSPFDVPTSRNDIP